MIARLFAALVSTAMVLGGASPALAQDEAKPTETTLTDSDAARETASKHFRRGVELFQETHYRAALIEFERAYETLPDFRLHYNLAQTKRLLLDYVGAVESYERYLADGGDAIPEERRQEVVDQLARMNERIAHLSITSNRDSVRIFVDDRLVGVTPITTPMAVNVGRHVVEARTSKGVESTQVVDVAGGDTLAVYLAVEEEAEPGEEATPAPATTPEKVETPPSKASRRYAITAMTLGGAAVLGAVGSGVVSAIEQKNFDQARDDGKLGAASKHADRAERSALATDILASVGLALAVSGIITWAVKKPTKDRVATGPELRWGIGAGSLVVQGEF